MSEIIMKSSITNNNNNNLKLSAKKTHYNLKRERDLQEPIIYLKDKNFKNDDLYENRLTFSKKEKREIQDNINKNNNIINRKKNNNYITYKNNNIKKTIYSYECINIDKLQLNLNKGSNEGKIKIILKNNGKESWPINKTKLIFDKDPNIKSEDIILNPQKPDETNSYDIIFKQIENYTVGEFKFSLWFNVDGQTYGDKIIITLKIIEKEKQKNEIEENMDKIKEFLEDFGLTEGECSNEKILEHLKKNNFDFEKTFNSLFE